MNEMVASERGSVGIVFLIGLLATLLACAAFAIDVGHGYAVRKELQNASDACALAGAGTFYPSSSYPTPMWSTAKSTAESFVGNNKADGKALETGEEQYGWWNIARREWKGGSPVSSGSPPGAPVGTCSGGGGSCTSDADCTGESCLMQEVPAMVSTIAKKQGVNGGPVWTPFARAAGWQDGFSITTKPAVAVSGSPVSAPKNSVFPYAITKCMADLYHPSLPSSSVVIGIYGSVPACQSGQWTSFLDRNNNVPSVAGLTTTGNNPVPLSVGDQIRISPGNRQELFAAAPSGIDVFLPVVADNSPAGNRDAAILGFMAFHIDSVGAGAGNAYLQGRFISRIGVRDMHPGGPNYGIFIPPILVK